MEEMPTTFGESITAADLESDPYPAYKRLQKEAPVCWVPAVRLWLATRWADIEYMCKHPEVFSAEIPHSPVTRTITGSGRLLILRFGPMRAVIIQLTVIEPIARELVTALSAPKRFAV